MSDLRKNIHRYMDIHSIKYYSDLLVMVGKELKVKDPYRFAEREKSNFSKMLKEERPLKHEFIIPLEKIFGVSMARLMNDGAYKLPLNKEDIPYIKGFRYYAYLDSMDAYEDEFERTMITNDGRPTICNSDEFNKTFLDYVVEYHSINALRFLIRKHKLTPYPHTLNGFEIDDKFSIFVSFSNELLIMAIQEEDVEVFKALFDPFKTCIMYGLRFENLKIELQVLEFLLESKKVFSSLFHPEVFPFTKFNRGAVGCDNQTIELLNPLLNECLDYALNDLERYRDIAKEILEFGIKYNKKIQSVGNIENSRLFIQEYGLVYYGHELIGSVVYPEYSTRDPEMLALICKCEIKGAHYKK